MESYISITQMNDFIFCPRSIYYHDIYRNTAEDVFYQQTPQVIGRDAHKTIDQCQYSTRRDILTGMTVYSQKYGLLGCIDIFDQKTGLLTERKYSVTAIYDGFRYQLYAQLAALTEMGYAVKSLAIHSKKDNKTYPVSMPTEADWDAFESVLHAMHRYSLNAHYTPNPKKCAHCIYSALCDKSPQEDD